MIRRLGFDKFSALYLWAGFMIFFGVTQHQFLTLASSKLVFGQENAIIGVLALAFLVPLTTGTYDLSIGYMTTASVAIVFKMTDAHKAPTLVAALLAILFCGAIGWVSGYVVVRLRVNSFIATLGMSQLLSAFVHHTSKQTINGVLKDSYMNIGAKAASTKGLLGVFVGQARYVYYVLILAIVLWYVLEHTPLGRYMFATGGNPEAARLAGVHTDRLVWGSLIASGMIAGFAGIVLSWQNNLFNPDGDGPAYLFPAVAAVFFGASQLKGRPNVWGSMIALYALAWGIKGLQLTFLTNILWITPLFQGGSLLIAVALASHRGIVKVKKVRNTARKVTPAPQASG